MIDSLETETRWVEAGVRFDSHIYLGWKEKRYTWVD
jgi:hypothetical protein